MKLVLLTEMASTRYVYKNDLEHHLIGAIVEYYKAEHAKANGKKKWVEHWSTESKQLLSRFRDRLLHAIRGFKNRKKAALEVLEIIKDGDPRYRRAAENEVNRDYNQVFRLHIPEDSTTRFHRLVLRIIEDNTSTI
jgi:hypothetical protein